MEGGSGGSDEAIRLFHLAADQGIPDAMTLLGICYRDDRRDIKEAARWWRLAVDLGTGLLTKDAQVRLGKCYFHGIGVEQNDEEAASLFRAAASQGDAEGQYCLALCYIWGHGVPQNAVEGARLCRLSEAQGYSCAQLTLGSLYANGEGGVPKDLQEAVKYYRLAADQGLVEAYEPLAECYDKGEGVPQDKEEAKRLYGLSQKKA